MVAPLTPTANPEVDSLTPDAYPLVMLVVHGEAFRLKAIAAPTYVFTGWEGDLTGNDTEVTLQVTHEKRVTAVFSLITYPLATTVEGGIGGSILVQTVPTADGYVIGTEVGVRADAGEGYRFSHWSGDASGSQNPLTIVLDSARQVTAHFVAVSASLWPWLVSALSVMAVAVSLYFLRRRPVAG